jgi:hypothetical protein
MIATLKNSFKSFMDRFKDESTQEPCCNHITLYDQLQIIISQLHQLQADVSKLHKYEEIYEPKPPKKKPKTKKK